MFVKREDLEDSQTFCSQHLSHVHDMCCVFRLFLSGDSNAHFTSRIALQACFSSFISQFTLRIKLSLFPATKSWYCDELTYHIACFSIWFEGLCGKKAFYWHKMFWCIEKCRGWVCLCYRRLLTVSWRQIIWYNISNIFTRHSWYCKQ